MTMSDYNSDGLRVLSQSSQTETDRQPEATMNNISLPALDISSNLDLGSIITPSELDSPNPEQWAELDSHFQEHKSN